MTDDIIAIVGSVGCGKTVLLSVLTHKFQNRNKNGFQIRPANQDAVKFCSEKWANLEHGTWPAPTEPKDKPPIYRWEIIHGIRTKQITTSDIAGEAWRKFIVEQVDSVEKRDTRSIWETIKDHWNSIPGNISQQAIETHITTVENMLNNASGIMLLLDLKQIIDKEQDYEQAMYLPTALVQYMNSINRGYVPVTLVLTKVDEYKYELSEAGSWEKVIEKYIPWIPRLHKILPVSAVADTKNKKPVKNFESEGLDDLCNNIWNIMSLEKTKRKIVLFACVDLPILIVLYIIYLLLVIVSPTAFLCRLFFWLMISAYGGFKLFYFVNKQR